MRSTRTVAGLSVLCSIACAADVPRGGLDSSRSLRRGADDATSRAPENPLLAAIRDALRARNPDIGAVGITEQRSLDHVGTISVVIGYGVRADRTFRGSFQDELFGIFVANDSLTRIVRTLDVLPSPRWGDYSFRIVRLTADSVRIEGKGDSYGDQPMRRTYSVEAFASRSVSH